MSNKVLVLMSTYNGERYLQTQIESILNQEGVDVHLLVRDDGSNDNTINILRSFVGEKLDFYTGANLRSAKSFIDLLIKCPKTYDYYAFSDQDDYWCPDKLISAIKSLEKISKPAVYCSNALLVDKDLNSLGRMEYNHIPNFTFQRVLIAGEVQGATMVMNRELTKYFNGIEMPDYVPMHDYFVSLVCVAIGGQIVFDPESHIKYRQHGGNVLGVDSSLFGKVRRNLSRVVKKNDFLDLQRMCQQLIEQNNFPIKENYLQVLELGATYKKSLKSRWRMTTLENMDFGKANQNIGYRLALLFGKI
ncbi:glycosyltransferase family 2 protein [Lactobacillus delbrueckii]|uniref:glycosyltransferase family 2 protein n=1 Tax=Lactobacillus delbrueckii TaxID=1584 RepID=UPI000E108613|nr:Alpha-L-Rha alpha-1,3-L-rhamnosyltransferase [Lactobacillus delbrueckii subsp. lactis]